MPGGRPKKKIDYETVEKLANIFCTQEEIATILDISTRTLQKDEEFLHVYKKGRENAKKSLRRIQFEQAENGSHTMAIWLGKQYLGQRDHKEIERQLEDTNEKLSKIARELEKSDTNSG